VRTVMEKPRILIVDDEETMRNLLRIHLANDFELREAPNGNEALALVNEEPIDLVLLDIMMPQVDGWEVCRKIRDVNTHLPIIMLTALNETKDKVEGLNLGADDYIVKPFDPDELIARINAQLRRSNVVEDEEINAMSESMIKMGDLKVFSNAREVYVNEEPVNFTPKEFDLLLLLASNKKWVYTREQLLDRIWGISEVLDIRTVDSHVKNIRVKLKHAGLTYNPIKTVWGVGYKIYSPEEKK
jgi:two-component system response regulator ResD